MPKLLLHGIERRFTPLEQDERLGSQLQDLAAELRTDQSTSAGDTHDRIEQTRAEMLRQGRHGIKAEQVFSENGAECIDEGPTGGEVIDRGDQQHRDRLALQLSHDPAAFAAVQRGDRQQHLIKLILDLTQYLGRLHRNVVERALP